VPGFDADSAGNFERTGNLDSGWNPGCLEEIQLQIAILKRWTLEGRMNGDRWQRVEEIFDRATGLEGDKQASYLDQACADDDDLKREVEQLLANDLSNAHSLTNAVANAAGGMIAPAAPAQTDIPADLSGKQIGPYHVTRRIGAGGMGIVYQARDTQLGRIVAIKVLPVALLQDAERRHRFMREAKTASALNHPNIITIHAITQADGMDCMVMEFVVGKSLEHLIGRKGLPLRDALRYAMQIADALAAAHAAGIVHRDLKPANIMVSENGLIKVLDFGLAKLTHPLQSEDAGSASASKSLTDEGRILGTVAYMSPEQAEGKSVDARSDIFSFGSVLYEMLSGRRAFQGDSSISILSAILNQGPSPIGPGIPHDLERIILRCLQKDPERRFQIVADLKVELEEVRKELEFSPGIAAVPQRRARKWLLAGLILVLSASIGGAALWRYARILNPEPSPSAKVLPFTSYPGQEYLPAFSPDGRQVAFVWTGENDDNPDIYVKYVGEDQRPLRLTSDPSIETCPTWSPDGQRIAFVRFKQGVATVYLISALGGSERKLVELGPRFGGLSWSVDDAFLAVSLGDVPPEKPMAIFLLRIGSGERAQLTSPPAGSGGDAVPRFSPDGKAVAFRRGPISYAAEGDLYLQYIQPDGAPDGEARRVTFERKAIVGLDWTPDGRSLIFSCNRDVAQRLWRVAVPLSSLGKRGIQSPEPLSFGSDGAASLSIARTGSRIAWVRTQSSDVDLSQVELAGLTSGMLPHSSFARSTRTEDSPHFSVDGKKVVFISDRSGDREVWTCGSQGENLFRVTSFKDHGYVGTPRWSPDGRAIAFDSTREGQRDVFVVSAEGGEARRVTTEPSQDVRPSWSQDGRWIYFGSDRSGDWQVWKVSPSGGAAVQVTSRGGREAFESYDGKYVYYAKQGDVRGIWRIPSNGGEETRILDQVQQSKWALGRDGIFYVDFSSDPRRILYYDFSRRRINPITELQKGMRFNANPSLAVSADGRSILYATFMRLESDIFLAENFR
jgi:eukaryotic-like serine/threonine-protein kinase